VSFVGLHDGSGRYVSCEGVHGQVPYERNIEWLDWMSSHLVSGQLMHLIASGPRGPAKTSRL
jgi:hypothetical protein